MSASRPSGDVDTRVQLASLSLANPILGASGCYGYGQEFTPYGDVSRLGAVIGKTITLQPRLGNPPPRAVETPCGMLNAIGLQNPGIDRYLDEKLPYLASLGSPVITSVAGITADEFVELARRIEARRVQLHETSGDRVTGEGPQGDRVGVCQDGGAGGIDALEVNLSCPNVEAGGRSFGCDPQVTGDIVRRVREVTSLPIVAKLSPNVPDVRLPARAAEEAGADALSLINTLVGMAVDWRRRRPVLANKTGGLSGPAIKPVALWQVHSASSAVSIPVLGIGGISCLDDVMEFLVAGASAVQVGTANFVDPTLAFRLVDEVPTALVEAGVSSLQELVGSLQDSSPAREVVSAASDRGGSDAGEDADQGVGECNRRTVTDTAIEN